MYKNKIVNYNILVVLNLVRSTECPSIDHSRDYEIMIVINTEINKSQKLK